MPDNYRMQSPVNDRDSSYCDKHRRYYSAGAGCPICRYEKMADKPKDTSGLRIEKCPVCREISLVWFRCSNRCECLNIDCKLRQMEPAEY